SASARARSAAMAASSTTCTCSRPRPRTSRAASGTTTSWSARFRRPRPSGRSPTATARSRNKQTVGASGPIGLLATRRAHPTGTFTAFIRARDRPMLETILDPFFWEDMLGQIVLGAYNGAFYAILSLGLAVIFGLLNIINFTHGAQYMMGAFAAWLLLQYVGIGYWAALVLVPIIIGAFGIVIERLML